MRWTAPIYYTDVKIIVFLFMQNSVTIAIPNSLSSGETGGQYWNKKLKNAHI